MKQILKKIMMAGLVATVLSIGVQAENTVRNFLNDGHKVGGLLDNEVIFVYRDKKVANEKNIDELSLLNNIAQKKICEAKDTRNLVEDLGLSVKFIYLNRGDATIIKIDNCKGVTTKYKRKGEV